MGKDKLIENTLEWLICFLFDTTGNEIFENAKEKHKLRGVLKKDKKFIRAVFRDKCEQREFNNIERFLFSEVFQNSEFYSVMGDLPEDKKERLNQEFCSYMKKETGDNYVNRQDLSKIIRCVNNHNEAVNMIILDSKSRIELKSLGNYYNDLQKSIKSINYVGNTLDTETELKNCDVELDYLGSQLESIMKSLRIDLIHRRRMQIIYTVGIIDECLLMIIVIPNTVRYMEYIWIVCSMLGFFLITLAVLLYVWKDSIHGVRIIERQISDYTNMLWSIHEKIYRIQLDKKFVMDRAFVTAGQEE